MEGGNGVFKYATMPSALLPYCLTGLLPFGLVLNEGPCSLATGFISSPMSKRRGRRETGIWKDEDGGGQGTSLFSLSGR